MPVPSAAPAHPLVVSSDDGLLDDLLRLLAAAGAEPEVATDGPALRRAHRAAPLVLLGSDRLVSPAVRSLPRRQGVVVVAAAPLTPEGWAAAVAVGAERVAVLPEDEAWLVSRVAGAVRPPVERGGVVAVSGSCGGAGTSTLAAALAVLAAPGSLLVDGDPWGGGLDLLLGAERSDGLRWSELTGLRGTVAGNALLAALPETGGMQILAADRSRPGDVPAPAITAVADAAAAEGCTVVLDLPRPRPGGGEEAADSADLAVLVVPARLRAAGAARLLVDAHGPPWSSAAIVVRTAPGGLSADDVQEVVGRPVLAVVGHDRSAASRGERGRPPSVGPRSPLGTGARRILDALAAQRRSA